MGREGQDGETHVHPWLIHDDIWQKPHQYCNYSQSNYFLKISTNPTHAGSDAAAAANAGDGKRCRLDPWVRKIP